MKRTIVLAAAFAILGAAALAPNGASARNGGNSNGSHSSSQSTPKFNNAKPTKPTIHGNLKIHCYRYRRADANGGSVTLAHCG